MRGIAGGVRRPGRAVRCALFPRLGLSRPRAFAPPQTRTATRSTGSGVLVERRGEVCVVLTAAHVIANSTFIQVQLARRTHAAARFTRPAHTP